MHHALTGNSVYYRFHTLPADYFLPDNESFPLMKYTHSMVFSSLAPQSPSWFVLVQKLAHDFAMYQSHC